METIENYLKNKQIKKIINYFIKTNRYISRLDARQEALLCLITAYNTYNKFYKIPFKSWFFRIVFNKFATLRKKHENELNFYKQYHIKTEKIKNNYALIFDDILNHKCLSNNEKQLLFGRFVEDKTLLELGNEFGVSNECIRLKINKCLDKLSQTLQFSSYYYF